MRADRAKARADLTRALGLQASEIGSAVLDVLEKAVERLVKKELRAKRLVSAAPPDAKGLDITMDVRVYREKPVLKELQRGGAPATRGPAAASKSAAQALWEYLLTQAARS